MPSETTAVESLDSYKLGHPGMFPKGTTKMYANFTARSNEYLNVPERYKGNKIVWVGFQVFLKMFQKKWEETFFKQPIDAVMQNFVNLVSPFCGPNGYDQTYLRNLHRLGYLPLHIKALPEGSHVNIGVPVLTVTNTHDDFGWLPNSIESWLSTEMWKTPTSATIALVYRNIIERYAKATGGSKEFIDWQGHDFSMRGMSGVADSAKSGIGHLVSFLGTDNIPAVAAINRNYSGLETFIGGSVPATEHSVMCAGGEENEYDTFLRLLKQYPSGIISIVSDTWDYWYVLSELSRELHDVIINRFPDSLGLAKVVFRPDSGDPVKIICGDKDEPVGSAAYKGSVEVLWEIFGGSTNDKGYRTLNPRVGLIYGDSITPERCEAILSGLMLKGFASDNIVFGIGSYTYQHTTRDTLGFAMKATASIVNGESRVLFKDPATGSGKRSARGLLRVEKEGTDFVLYQEQTPLQETLGELRTVFLNGSLVNEDTFANIRQRLSNRGV